MEAARVAANSKENNKRTARSGVEEESAGDKDPR